MNVRMMEIARESSLKEQQHHDKEYMQKGMRSSNQTLRMIRGTADESGFNQSSAQAKMSRYEQGNRYTQMDKYENTNLMLNTTRDGHGLTGNDMRSKTEYIGSKNENQGVTHQQSIFEHVLESMQISDSQDSMQTGFNQHRTYTQSMAQMSNNSNKQQRTLDLDPSYHNMHYRKSTGNFHGQNDRTMPMSSYHNLINRPNGQPNEYMEHFQTITEGSLENNRSFKTAQTQQGMSMTVLKEERVKLWGMFKLKPKIIKIVLFKKDGEDMKIPSDQKRQVFLQIEDVQLEGPYKKADRPERMQGMQDFKEQQNKQSKMSCLPLGCGPPGENNAQQQEVQAAAAPNPKKSSGYSSFFFSQCAGGRKDYVHEMDEPIRALPDGSKKRGINDLSGILIKIADITSVARKSRQKSNQMHIQYMNQDMAPNQTSIPDKQSSAAFGSEYSGQNSSSRAQYKVQSIWLQFERKEDRVQWEQTLWEIAIREKGIQRKTRDRTTLMRHQKQQFGTPSHPHEDQLSQEQRIMDYRMKKHFEKKQEIYEEFENLFTTIKSEQDLNMQRKYIECKLQRINKQINKCFLNFELQQQSHLLKLQQQTSMNTSPLNTSMGNDSNKVNFTESNQGLTQDNKAKSKFVSAKSNNETFGVIEEQVSNYEDQYPSEQNQQKEFEQTQNSKRTKETSPSSFHDARQSFTYGTSRKRSSLHGKNDTTSMNDESQQFKSCMGDDDEDVFLNIEQYDSQSNGEIGIIDRQINSSLEMANMDPEQIYYDERTELPYLKPPGQKVSVWKIIKDSIGKDLSKITMPVTLNEPLSMLQKLVEFMENEDMLRMACQQDDPAKRMMYILAFNIGQYKSCALRIAKPFNPLLGETFEFRTTQYECICEQVSHHPPISASHIISRNGDYKIWVNTEVKSKFWGNCMELAPLGLMHIQLTKYNEIYTIHRPVTTVNNLMIGQIYLDQIGDMRVVKRQIDTNMIEQEVIVNFKKGSWTNKHAKHAVEGTYPIRAGCNKNYVIGGTWSDGITVLNEETEQEFDLWKPTPLPDNSLWNQNFSKMSLQLNHLTETLKVKLPQTDVRFRPDQQALEIGDFDKAAEEKHRLEEKQRAARKQRAKDGIDYKPQYFELFEDPETGEAMWKMCRDYWKDRRTQNWQHLPHLY